jgi:hypothetical protein
MERKIELTLNGAEKAAPFRLHPHISFAIRAAMVLIVVIAATLVLAAAENYFTGGKGLSAIDANSALSSFEQQSLSP